MIYSVVYALIICVNLSAQIFAYSKAPVSIVTLMSMGGGILIPSIFGIVWFGEPLTARLIISSLLIITASFLPFVGKRGEEKPFSLAAVLTCLLMFVLAGLSVIPYVGWTLGTLLGAAGGKLCHNGGSRINR